MTRYTAQDISGVVAILPTPSLPGSDRWDARETVDVAETERLTNALIDDGVDVIMTCGTFAEGASLTLDEVITFNDTVIRTVAGRRPVFAGATTLNTRDTIDRGRTLRDLGADGLFLGRPMWVALDAEQTVEFHRNVAEALPDMAQIAYDNPNAFKRKISPQEYARLAEIPQIVAAKHMGLGLMGERFAEDLAAVSGRIRLLPVAGDWSTTARRFPDEIRACWSGDVAAGPAPVLRLRDAILDRDWDRAEKIQADIGEALEPLFPNGSFEEFSKYNIQIDRAEFEAAGYYRPGPVRPPYSSCPDEYLECGREAGRRWAALHSRYSAEHTTLA
ncbi:dihydrodipicolinate synthase family protein [Rhodococcus sp. T2V]|uniref:dihydrodipicolinate synthase family protein n=1 Tax=Rhodococcus sp. T2V TaxID=3034164 RepID=UPI0023E2A02D|nr:dihydrodipicolinate synthase family protein [Rhodococcus sp. T2V]MDF3305340.1 dihydrodipicolinate synthase family protein [Rhodococcus sp. T2V]